LPIRFGAGLDERLEEPLPIHIVVGNGLAPIAAIDEVMKWQMASGYWTPGLRPMPQP